MNAKRLGSVFAVVVIVALFLARAIGCALADSPYLLVLKNRFNVPIRIGTENGKTTIKPSETTSWYMLPGGSLDVSAYDLKGNHLRDFRFSNDDLERLRHGRECRIDLKPWFLLSCE